MLPSPNPFGGGGGGSGLGEGDGDGKRECTDDLTGETFDCDAPIEVTGPRLPPGYKWAPDPRGQYWIAPNGRLVISPTYSQTICDNWAALNQSMTEVNDGAIAGDIAGGALAKRNQALSFVSTITMFHIMITQRNAPRPSFYGGNNISNFSIPGS